MQRQTDEVLLREIQDWLSSPLPSMVALPVEKATPIGLAPAKSSKKPAVAAFFGKTVRRSFFQKKQKLTACAV